MWAILGGRDVSRGAGEVLGVGMEMVLFDFFGCVRFAYADLVDSEALTLEIGEDGTYHGYHFI